MGVDPWYLELFAQRLDFEPVHTFRDGLHLPITEIVGATWDCACFGVRTRLEQAEVESSWE